MKDIYDGRRSQASMRILLSVLVFILLLVTMLIVVGVSVILVDTGIITFSDNRFTIELLILALGIVSIVMGTALAAVLSRLLLKPLNRLAESMTLLSSGRFDTRLESKGLSRFFPFVLDFVDSFNRMAEELGQTEMLQEDFINNFSHEFKTPIVSIAGFAKLLRTAELPEQTREEYLSVIEKESLRLSEMANKVLELTHVENRKILSERTVFNLSEQIRECFLLIYDKWSQKELELSLDFDEFFVYAEKELLKQVWINLIDNAVRCTPQHGNITVTITEQNKKIIVRITNTGSKISTENLERIFRKFYQEDESHASPGNGIGLAVVKRVTELHNGTVYAESDDNGTTFTVELPENG